MGRLNHYQKNCPPREFFQEPPLLGLHGWLWRRYGDWLAQIWAELKSNVSDGNLPRQRSDRSVRGNRQDRATYSGKDLALESRCSVGWCSGVLVKCHGNLQLPSWQPWHWPLVCSKALGLADKRAISWGGGCTFLPPFMHQSHRGGNNLCICQVNHLDQEWPTCYCSTVHQ